MPLSRLDENGNMAQAVSNYLTTRETVGNTAAKVLVMVGASHMNHAVTAEGKQYPSIAEKLTQECGLNEKLIFSFYLCGQKEYTYAKMRGGEGYNFPDDIPTIPMSQEYYSSPPKITRRLSTSTIIEPKNGKDDCSIQ